MSEDQYFRCKSCDEPIPNFIESKVCTKCGAPIPESSKLKAFDRWYDPDDPRQ